MNTRSKEAKVVIKDPLFDVASATSVAVGINGLKLDRKFFVIFSLIDLMERSCGLLLYRKVRPEFDSSSARAKVMRKVKNSSQILTFRKGEIQEEIRRRRERNLVTQTNS